MTHADLATDYLRIARAALVDAAYHIQHTGREDAALLAQRCDESEQDVRAVQVTVAERQT